MAASAIVPGESGENTAEKEDGKLSLRMKLVTPVDEVNSDRFSLQSKSHVPESLTFAILLCIHWGCNYGDAISQYAFLQNHPYQKKTELQSRKAQLPVLWPGNLQLLQTLLLFPDIMKYFTGLNSVSSVWCVCVTCTFQSVRVQPSPTGPQTEGGRGWSHVCQVPTFTFNILSALKSNYCSVLEFVMMTLVGS